MKGKEKEKGEEEKEGEMGRHLVIWSYNKQ